MVNQLPQLVFSHRLQLGEIFPFQETLSLHHDDILFYDILWSSSQISWGFILFGIWAPEGGQYPGSIDVDSLPLPQGEAGMKPELPWKLALLVWEEARVQVLFKFCH